MSRRPLSLEVRLPDLPPQVSPEVLDEWQRVLGGVLGRAVRIAVDTLDLENEKRATQGLRPLRRLLRRHARGGRE